jgi:hypothetical protein
MRYSSRTAQFAAFAPICCLLLSLAGCADRGLEKAHATAAEVITPDLIRRHIFFLASDSMKGRNTPSAELDSAARYIAENFRSDGLQGVGGSYFEKVGLAIVALGEENYLKITKDGLDRSYAIKTDFMPFDLTASREVSGAVVFAGYGITAPEYRYDDYKDIDVHGKIVFVLRHEPGEEDTASIFLGKRPTEYSDVSRKVQIAVGHGAVGVLVATDPLNHATLTPRGFPWPSLSKFLPQDALPMTLTTDEGKKVPVLHVGEEVISRLFGSVEALKDIQSRIDAAVKPQSYTIPGVTVSMKTTTKVKDMSTQNVVGFLEGSDPALKDQILVIGAHYDHLGYKKQHSQGEDYIFNGADDNASGTTAVLAIAEAFSRMPLKPRRSVLFVTFAGEEKGLFGSRSYVSAPLFPLEKTVAMLNLDMVGRNGIDSLYMVGASRSPDLAKINDEENRDIGFTLIGDESEIGGSDHASFYQKKVPFLFYFTGLHSDYHQVSDEPARINLEKIARVARLAFRTAWRVANDDHRYRVIDKQ